VVEIKASIQKGAYIFALKRLVEINHPLVTVLFPRMKSLEVVSSPSDNDLSSDEIEQLKHFINGEKTSILIQASVLLAVSTVVLIAGVVGLMLFISFGVKALTLTFVPCCASIIAVPVFGMSCWQLHNLFRHERYGLF
jgi:hypothetical protein